LDANAALFTRNWSAIHVQRASCGQPKYPCATTTQQFTRFIAVTRATAMSLYVDRGTAQFTGIPQFFGLDVRGIMIRKDGICGSLVKARNQLAVHPLAV
jgi:hypothetical protein